jgi:DNA-directed RNA polymerase subunit RPC12/RpoP
LLFIKLPEGQFMASTTCTHCGAALKTKTEIEPGKKIKCPKCGKSFVVDAVDEDDKPVKNGSKNSGGDDNGAPKKKGKSEEPRSNAMLFGLIGGALLLCCCCTTIPGAGWYFRDKLGLDDPKKADMVNKGDHSKTAFKVTSEELAKEFIADAKGAEAKYKDKFLEVTGELHNVIPESVSLKGTKNAAQNEVRVLFEEFGPAQQAIAFRFSKGQRIKAVGKYAKFGPNADVWIVNAVFTELEPSKILLVSSEDLVKELEQDKDAARQKYKNRDLIVTGVVERIFTDKTHKAVFLKGSANTRFMIPVSAARAEDLVPGRTVEIRSSDPFLSLANNLVMMTPATVVSSK